MNLKSKRTLTPNLRFPEFREEWQPATIEKVFKSDDKPVKATRFESDKILTVKLHTNGVVRNMRTDALTGGTNYFIRRAGQFIFSKIDLLNGAFGIVPMQYDGFYSSSDVPAFSFSKEHSPTFFLNWLTNRYRRLDIERTGTSSTLKRVSPERFWELPILLPTLPEQQKIAECLGSLDGLIAAEGRKLAALRDHKRGLMQQLFPQPGQTRPRLRFPEFRGKGEWEGKKAGSLFSQRKEKGQTRLPIYSVTINDGMVLRSTFDRNFYDIEDPAGNKKAHKNDIAYNMMRMWQGACGVAPEDCMVSPAYVVLKPKKGTYPAFFDVLFKRPAILHLLMAYSRGLTLDRLRLYFDDFASIPLLVPSEPEQQRIADCLTALDTQIAAQAAKIESLKQHKRGLMQQLFPAPEELQA
jgi:type I restriction enzyme S subunit